MMAKQTLYDIVAILVFLVTGLTIIGLGVILLEELELNLALWVYIVSMIIFCMCCAVASTTVDKVRGKRSELGKEIDALRKRVDKTCPLSFALSLNEEIDALSKRIDALERGVKE